MNNEKGLTLLEVLASVMILAIAILSVTFIFQQTALSSKNNSKTNDATNITRAILEDIKYNLKNSDTETRTIFNQTVDLRLLRQAAPVSTHPIIYYPSADNQQFEITITTKIIADSSFMEDSVNISDFFRIVHLQTKNLETGQLHTIESYVEI